MYGFWLGFLLPVLLLMVQRKSSRNGLLWFGLFTFFSVFIGLRHEVGGDWFSYVYMFELITYQGLLSSLSGFDPGYAFICWLSAELGGDVYLVNLFSAALFSYGLLAFCRRQPMPLLAVVVAVPYIITVVAMGYTRQAIALGFLFLALNALVDGKTIRFILLVIVAALFHKTAAILMPLAAFTTKSHRLFKGAMVLVFAYALFDAVVGVHFETLWQNYVVAQMHSSGAMIRVVMNVVPAVLFFMFYRQFKQQYADYRIWRLFALAALACVPMVFMASTATDRIALYITPLQIALFSRLPMLLSDSARGQMKFIWLTVAGYAAVLFVWLNFATHAQYWLPYQNILFMF